MQSSGDDPPERVNSDSSDSLARQVSPSGGADDVRLFSRDDVRLFSRRGGFIPTEGA